MPSRENVADYQAYRAVVEGLVGRINGRWATVGHTPVQFLHRSLGTDALVSLYRAADALLVTSLRDGMNLVAKEFVAARNDEDGVLILSEFAGAAAELGEALVVNPNDVDGMATACQLALTMPREERRRRMRALRAHVRTHNVTAWVSAFLTALSEVPEVAPPRPVFVGGQLDPELEAVVRAPSLTLLLDHDGTLVPLAPTPDRAPPDADLLALLELLSRLPGTRVHVISGRDRETLERWYGGLAIGLHAEHGSAFRLPGDGRWRDLGLSLGTGVRPSCG